MVCLKSLQLTVVLPAAPAEIYAAWMDSKAHSDFTGDAARVDPRVGGRFTAWDGYITGETLELEPGRRIVQAWRTSEFPVNSPDSILEVLLEKSGEGTLLTLNQTNIPDGQGEECRQGWIDNYFEPMSAYFEEKKSAG